MKKMTCFVMALALVLGLAQCKKETIEPQGEKVRITLNVDGGASTGSATNGSRAEVNPPRVNFVSNDEIVVAYDGKYVGTLTHNGSYFEGDIEITPAEESQPLYFYFLGNNQGSLNTSSTGCTVNISDQTNANNKPVISMGKSTDDYDENIASYSSKLYNKASLMKFNVDTPSDAAICIIGMNNTVTVTFNDRSDNDGFSYGMDLGDGGLIMMAPKDDENVTWAIVLPQAELPKGEYGTAFSADHSYTGSRPALSAIEPNKYLDAGVDMTVNNSVIWGASDIEGINIESFDGQITIEGISVRGEGDASFSENNIELFEDGRLVFSAPGENVFTRIEIAYGSSSIVDAPDWTISGEWWEPQCLVWNGETPASTVTLPAKVLIRAVSQITFTFGAIEPTPPTPSPSGDVGSLVYDEQGNPIAMIAYVRGDYSLAISLVDWTVQDGPYMDWNSANEVVANHDGTWRLPTVEDWLNMIYACGGEWDGAAEWNCDGLMSKISDAGGEPMNDDSYYWTGTDDGNVAEVIQFESDGYNAARFSSIYKGNLFLVRPVLQIGSAPEPVEAAVEWEISDDFSCNTNYTSDGITATLTVANADDPGSAVWDRYHLELTSGSDDNGTIVPSSVTFSSDIGNITKIVINYDAAATGYFPSGWRNESSKLIWEGNPTSSVSITSSDEYAWDNTVIHLITKVEFYVVNNKK